MLAEVGQALAEVGKMGYIGAMTKLIPLSEWAKKNKVPDRTVRRLAQQGRIPTKPLAVYIIGIDPSFKLPKKV